MSWAELGAPFGTASKLPRAGVNVCSALCNPLLAHLGQKATQGTSLHKRCSAHTLPLLTKGNDGVCSNHRRHDRAFESGERLRGRGFAAALRGGYYRERKKGLVTGLLGLPQTSHRPCKDDVKCLTMIRVSRRSQNGLDQKEGSLLHSGGTELGYIS